MTKHEFTVSLDYAGAGGGSACWVQWRGITIEHFNRSAQLDAEMRAKLTEQCEHLERLGVVPRTSTVVWHWEWFKDCPTDSPYLSLLRLCPGIYEHGMTAERKAESEEASVPVNRICESDGSMVFVLTQSHGVLWRPDNSTEIIECPADKWDFSDWYHTMEAMDYHTLRARQNVFNGECYATYGGLCEAFASKNFTAKSVRAVLDAAMEIPV